MCEIAAEITVRGFKNKHDPNLVVQIDDTLDRNFRVGDEIVVRGVLSRPSFINVLAWYPEIDRENLYRLHSDEQLNEPNFSDFFELPPKTQSSAGGLFFQGLHA